MLTVIMAAHRHTKDSIVQTLKNIAVRLGKSALSKRDIERQVDSAARYHFGSLRKALDAAGLSVAERDISRYDQMRLSDDTLFASIWEAEQAVGHEPNFSEYRSNGGSLSSMPFRKRFGKWESTLQYYRKWKADKTGSPQISQNVKANSELPHRSTAHSTTRFSVKQPSDVPVGRTSKTPQLYGEPIEFRGLRHAPINEQGVVYLFGMVSRELGFSIEALQQGFPDCEGKYLHDKSRNLWAKARIEFEFRASNFREHGHNDAECDVVVCWENDWPDCPLRVVELKSELLRLPSR